MNLLSVAKRTPPACGQRGPEWPQAPARGPDLALQFSRLQASSPGNPTPRSLLFCADSKLGHLGLPSVWEKEPDSGASGPLGSEDLVPARNTLGSPHTLGRGALRSRIFSETHVRPSAGMRGCGGRPRGGDRGIFLVRSHRGVSWPFSACLKRSTPCVLRGEGWCCEEAVCNSWLGLR